MEKLSLTEEIIAQIGGYMRVGADFILATAAIGISEEIAQEWYEKAQQAGKTKEDSIYLKLHEQIRQGTAQAEVIALQRLSAEGGSSGAKWLLEKINPEKYKDKKTEKEPAKINSWSPYKPFQVVKNE